MCGGGVVYLLLKVVANGPGLGLVSITLNFVQTILVLREINMKWTPEFDFVMNYLSFLNFNIELIAPECLTSDEVLNYVFKMRITLAMPLILFGFLATVIILNHADVQEAIIYGVRPVVRKLKIPVQNQVNKVALQRTQKETILKAAKALNALLSLLYITVTTRTLGYFDCTKELDGFYYLDSDASFRCYDSRWMDHSAAAWLGLIFYVLGIPLYFMTFFFLLHQEKFSGAIWLKCKRKVKKIIDSDLNYIKPDYQYFMLLQILQKLTLICINIFFSKFVSVQILTSILVLLVAFNMYKKHCPYAYPTLNFLEIISVLSAKVVLALGLLLYTEQFESREMQFTITVFLLIFILGVIGVAIFCAFYEFYKGFRKIKFVDTLFTKVVPKSIRNDHRSQKRKMKSTTDLPVGDSQIMKSTQPK
ncbi:hypothetical protein BKA69DRAFT_670345 [Paraphysoderma sedebokerense]|nr:hypothetical protein BKA69DRAFT_670345 [Paraphysoderma sedebokerense]